MNGDPKGIGAGRDTTGSSGPKLGGVGGAQRGLRHRKGRGGGQSRNPSSQSRSGAVLSPPLKVLELSWEDGQTPTLGGWEGGERRREPKTQPGVPQNPELTALGRCAPQDGDGDGVGLGDGGGGGARVYPTRPRGAFTALQGRGLPNARGGGAGCGSGSGLPRGARRAERWKSLFGAVSEAGGAAGPPLCRPAELRAQRWR